MPVESNAQDFRLALEGRAACAWWLHVAKFLEDLAFSR